MCYPKPGPRCAGHTRKDLLTAHSRYEEVKKSGNEEEVTKARKEFIDAQKEYYSTPKGNKELQAYAYAHGSEEHEKLANSLKTQYDKKLSLLKETTNTPVESSHEEETVPPVSEEVEKELRTLRYDNIDTIIAVDDSTVQLSLNGRELNYFEEVKNLDTVQGQSKEVADFMSSFTEGESQYDDGLHELTTISHTPSGEKLDTHYANSFHVGDKEYVVDFSSAELDPNNHEYPLVLPVEEWRQKVESVSEEGRPPLLPEPHHPRAGKLPLAPVGEKNPLVEKAVIEEPVSTYTGSITRYLSVDNVRVAAVKYHLNEDNHPVINSLETRPEYRRQGYMGKLMEELSSAYNVEKPISGGGYTTHGYNYTRHMTEQSDDAEIRFPSFTDENPFSFVGDWIEGKNH